MKYYLSLILILLISSCEFFSQNNWNTKTIKLGNSSKYFGELQLKLPKEYDTIITWTDHSDDYCDDRQKHRFQSKKFPPMYDTLKNVKFLFDEITPFDETDSLFGITISNGFCPNNFWVEKDTFDTKKYIESQKMKMSINNPSDSVRIKNIIFNIIRINGLNFVTNEKVSNRNDSNDSLINRTNLIFSATTYYNGLPINFRFENSTKNFEKEDYFETCLEILKTVKFSK